VITRWMLVWSLCACEMIVGSSLWAGESRPRDGDPSISAISATPVTRQEVWQAVAAELRQHGTVGGWSPQVEDLDLPVAVPALAGRKLRVSSSCWDEGLRRTQFRLECGAAGQCLPFLAYLREPVNAGATGRVASCRLTSRLHAELKAVPKPTVRAGDRATAVFVADRLNMTAGVTCLEPGREGDVIRVRRQDGHVFRARISGPDRLEVLPQELVRTSRVESK